MDAGEFSVISNKKADIIYTDSVCQLISVLHSPCFKEESHGRVRALPVSTISRKAVDSPVCSAKRTLKHETFDGKTERGYGVGHPKFNGIAGLIALLKQCAKEKDLHTGSMLHSDIIKKRRLRRDIYVGNTLVNMYAKCGALDKAREVFEELTVRDVVSWNVLITGYAQHGLGQEAIDCFEMMQREGLSPNPTTYLCVLKACAKLGSIDKGEKIHSEIVREGLLEQNTNLGTALIDMYVKCGAMSKAQEVFDKISVRDVVSWNVLIAGYAQHGHGQKALNAFERMQSESISPDGFTFVCLLNACGTIRALDKGIELHTEIMKQGILGKDKIVGNALVDMYVKFGALVKAQEVANQLPVRDVVCWTTLIGGYVQYGHGDEAIDCYERMRNEGLFPNAATFICVLKACSLIGASTKGEEIHADIIRDGLDKNDFSVVTALVDMYAKCGALDKAQGIFDKLPIRDVVSWTALITGYAQDGQDDIVCESFEEMIEEGIQPNMVTFTVVLNSCSHSGLLEKGDTYFQMMKKCYGMVPNVEQHTCMVNLFGRAGHFNEAVAMIKRMPTWEHLPVWTTLLGACQKWGNVQLGEWAFEHAIKVDQKDPGPYIAMANIYSAADMQEAAEKVEALRIKNAAWRDSSLS